MFAHWIRVSMNRGPMINIKYNERFAIIICQYISIRRACERWDTVSVLPVEFLAACLCVCVHFINAFHCPLAISGFCIASDTLAQWLLFRAICTQQTWMIFSKFCVHLMLGYDDNTSHLMAMHAIQFTIRTTLFMFDSVCVAGRLSPSNAVLINLSFTHEAHCSSNTGNGFKFFPFQPSKRERKKAVPFEWMTMK